MNKEKYTNEHFNKKAAFHRSFQTTNSVLTHLAHIHALSHSHAPDVIYT